MDFTPFCLRFNEMLRSGKIDIKGIASRTGIPLSSLESLRDGHAEPSMDDLFKLANYFGVSVNYLAGNSDRKGNGLKKFVKIVFIVLLLSAIVRFFYWAYEENSGIRAAREAQESMLETAEKWKETEAKTIYD